MIKNFIRFIACLFFLSSTAHAVGEGEHVYRSYPTRFGVIEYMRPSQDVRLNGKLLVKSGQRKDMYDRTMDIYEEDSFAAPSGRGEIIENGKAVSRRLIDRVLLSEAGIGTCLQHFIIIDLRGRKPYVTNSFGDNPRGEYCFTVKKIKWGKNETMIYFSNGTKYLYPTGEDVFGPVD